MATTKTGPLAKSDAKKKGAEKLQDNRPLAEPASKSDPKTIGGRLVICRNALEITQAEAARRIGVKQPSLGDLESGDSGMPRGDTLLGMRDARYNPDYVIRGKGMPLLPDFEGLAQEQALILIFRELRPEIRGEAIKSVQALRRAQGGGASKQDPFPRDPPDED